jgi:cyanate lyase
MHITQVWPKLLDDNGYAGKAMPLSPISFSGPDVHQTRDVLQQQEDTDTQFETIRNAIGINTDGWTPNEEYEGAVRQAQRSKKYVLESLDIEEEKVMTLKHWPFDDFDEEE